MTTTEERYGDEDVITEDDIRPENVKIRITTMLDQPTLLGLKAAAKVRNTKYQTLLNEILRNWVLAQSAGPQAVTAWVGTVEGEMVRAAILHVLSSIGEMLESETNLKKKLSGSDALRSVIGAFRRLKVTPATRVKGMKREKAGKAETVGRVKRRASSGVARGAGRAS